MELQPDDGGVTSPSSANLDFGLLLAEAAGTSWPAPQGTASPAADAAEGRSRLLRYVRSLLFRPLARGRLAELVAAAEGGDKRWAAAVRDTAGA